MRRDEIRRLTVIHRLIEGSLSVADAAALLQLSTRQVLRLKKRVLEEGEEGIIHKNRGRKPKHALPDELKHKIVSLYSTPAYTGCNDSHFTELLAEREGICVSVSTVRRTLRAAGIPPARKHRPAKRHRVRPRKERAGLLWQMDASQHSWLEDRGPKLVLHAAIDDATGRVVGAVFCSSECLEGYFTVLHQAISSFGIPVGIYVDRHTIFRSPKADRLTIEEELAGVQPMTQFSQAVSELGISLSFARSPQAKGRIERLWGTLQDRLTMELRLRQVSTLEEANRVLPELIEKYNARFAVEPAEPESAYRPLGQKSLDRILCIRAQRKLSHGQTISWQGQTYRVASGQPPLQKEPHSAVEVRLTQSGQLWLWDGHTFYLLEPCPKPKPQENKREDAAHASSRSPYKPPADHPWRKFRLGPASKPTASLQVRP